MQCGRGTDPPGEVVAPGMIDQIQSCASAETHERIWIDGALHGGDAPPRWYASDRELKGTSLLEDVADGR